MSGALSEQGIRARASRYLCLELVFGKRVLRLHSLLVEISPRDGSRDVPSSSLVEMLRGDACGGARELPLCCLLAFCLAAASQASLRARKVLRKLERARRGPFTVITHYDNGSAKIQKDPCHTGTVNIRRLGPFHEEQAGTAGE